MHVEGGAEGEVEEAVAHLPQQRPAPESDTVHPVGASHSDDDR
jgi:hypothetical protein